MLSDTAGESPAGDPLIEALTRLPSIDVYRSERICSFGKPLSIVIVGGMCAGKSTLAYGAAGHPMLVDCCEVVPRYSTRMPRRGDTAEGLTSISWDEFRRRRESGKFALAWERPLADGSRIGYGCLGPSSQAVPIFMAGHGVYTNKATLQPSTALDRALVVGVDAPADVRAERLRLRSPDVVAQGLTAMERLLAHDDDKMAANIDMLVRNYGATEAAVIDDFAQALALVLDFADYKLRSST